MTTDLSEVIRELSEVYDENSQDTYVTLYLNKATNGVFLQKREQVCTALLKGDERKNFVHTMKELRDLLKKNAADYVAIFGSYKHNFFKTISLPVAVNNSLVVDSSPYIRPLARIHDEWESFTLVLLDSHYAKIFSVSLGKVEHEKSLSSDIINKHKKGGWSQARFQRLRKGAIHAFFLEVEAALEKAAENQIVLAGPGQAKLEFRDMLSKQLVERIVAILDISIDDEQQLLKESIHLISRGEKKKSREAVQHLREEVLKDGLAVYGMNETLQMVKNGQVELLVIEKDYKIAGWICETCQVVEAGKTTKCPFCGGTISEVDVLEEILEFAERTGADIEFTSDEELAHLGHVGAILRFK